MVLTKDKMDAVLKMAAATSLSPSIVMPRDVSSLKYAFYKLRIVDTKTGEIKGAPPVAVPTYISRKIAELENTNDILLIENEHGLWVPVTNRKTKARNVFDCIHCYGYGMWHDEYDRAGNPIPMTLEEAKKEDFADECPWCGADNYYYWKSVSSENTGSKSKLQNIDTLLKEFEEKVKCAVFSDTSEMDPSELPW